MSSRMIVVAAIAFVLSACAPQPAPRGPVLFDNPGDPARLRQTLSDLGFAVAASESGLPATLTIGPRDARARCETIYLRDNFGERTSRGRFVDADQVTISATMTDRGQLRLSAQGRYLNRFDNTRTANACEVSESFETEIANALDPG